MKAHTSAIASMDTAATVSAFAQSTLVNVRQNTSAFMEVSANTTPVVNPGGQMVKVLKRATAYTTVALTAGLLLSGCVTASPNTPDGCVGPPDFCQPFFGN
jgi:hypothetical protein